MSLELGSNVDEDLVDRTKPEGAWQFDAEVTRVFDDMLRRSIPQYEVMRKAVFDVGSARLGPDATVVDCGASRGEAIAPFVEHLGDRGEFLCIEVAEPMLASLRTRFAREIAAGRLDVLQHDLRHGYPEVTASLTLSILTLQFTPIEYRQRIVSQIYDSTEPGGSFILVEKVLGEGAELNDLMVRLYRQHKIEHGYSAEDVARKALALEGVLVPISARWNVELLRTAGFTQVDCFWRWMNFAGWIATKPA